jgi:hypothetical protein
MNDRARFDVLVAPCDVSECVTIWSTSGLLATPR